ncbi:MAG: DNA polymerase/3'-5' exonuclease PolX [Nitrospirota bacterium]|nr:MAG: DNA polymerase/3'-5' exonuclease PolX [Nitrospirota bacterium]
MIKKEISKIFRDMADLLEVKGDNPFRIRAYRRASQSVEGISSDVSKMTEKELVSIPGIGKDLAGKIKEYSETGKIGAWEDLKRDVPEGIIDIISIPGVGPRTAKLIFDELGISTLEGLESALEKGRLRGIGHIKDKTEQNILKGIKLIKKGRERVSIGLALPLAEGIVRYLKEEPYVDQISVAGSIRRWKESVKDIDILVTSDEPSKVMHRFVSMAGVSDIIAKGSTKSSVYMNDGIQVDLRVVDDACFGAALQYFTGSKEHNVRLRELAVKKKLKINEYGVFDAKTEKFLGGRNEEDIYKVLDLKYVEPELRENTGEIVASAEGTLPKLIEVKDIKGDLHVHSDWSDGGHSIEDIAMAASRRGYKYIALTDHSKGLGIANGLTEERILAQIKEIDKVNKQMNDFTVLKGLEVDIRSDLTLDIRDEVLSRLDIVVASIHSGFGQSKEKITKRLISAMENPYVDVIAHPTGRLIGKRDAYEVDMDEVLKAAKRTGAVIEINAFPARLDLNDIHTKEAKKLGVKLAISTDTHIEDHFDYMKYGVAVARRGWLEKKDVINTKSAKALIDHLKKKRKD